MYRVAAPPRDANVPRELELALADQERIDKPSIALLQVFSLPPLVGILLSWIASPNLALAGMVIATVLAVLWWRKKGEVLVLRVDDGEVTLAARGAKKVK